ncbi:ATP-binding protein [Faecalibacillus sp. MSK20_93]|uniref:AAA family ATPase n=1 Tax=Faecalibacillus sp. MSK20_93 TaxID=2884903 RepID=UPI001D0B29FE|nr:AAA family ATPase [Faecalibacillus sp. MSK20_93]MCB7509465.1 ATP-binding protein [bacterium MSK20_81]MCB8549076.1 ATP-binding protein [Faecalibacillus sp. MSK20_93]
MKLIPTGIENFKTMIDKNAYYVDKTNLIADILNEQVVLYTRPRRFGKTLNMSMLYYFFSIKEKENAYLFNDLYISKNKEALEHQNKYPTILISLKEMKSSSFKAQIIAFSNIIYELLEKNLEILSSAQLTDTTKKKLNSLHDETTSIEDLKFSLRVISNALYTHYHQKVIVLIDEYDVPLQSAYQNNYYDEMVDFLRSVFSSALKTNDALEKGIMTGCLRISKESIFTGLNNFNSYSLLNNRGSEYFGFNENEVKQLLEDYQLSSYMDEVKEWYDGYLFGNIEIYNPWSTLMYVDKKSHFSSYKPTSFWANTSGNDLVVNYIQNGSDELHEEFEQLIQGKSLEKYIKPELTYREMDHINNIYSFLLLTGYLRVIEDLGENKYKLVIPNKEVYEIYKQSFMSYFEDYTFVRKEDLYQCLVREDVDQANEILGDILSRSISYFDNQESFYHGFLVELFSGKKIKSNREAMHGRFDLCILPKQIFQTALILECKHSKSVKELVSDAKEGAKQIIDNKYEDEIINDGYLHVKGYGISFYKKYCYIVKAENS